MSTDSKFRRLVIRIDSSISRMMTNTANEFLEGLINIKYLELSEVVITMEMCEITDRPIKLIA